MQGESRLIGHLPGILRKGQLLVAFKIGRADIGGIASGSVVALQEEIAQLAVGGGHLLVESFQFLDENLALFPDLLRGPWFLTVTDREDHGL